MDNYISDFKVGIISLGCAKNLVNTEQMMFLLTQAGFEVTGEIENGDIDIVLLNTCGFIESAKSEAIDTIIRLGEMKERGEFSKLVVSGCLPERYKDEILAEMPEIDAIVGTGAFDEIVQAVREILERVPHNSGSNVDYSNKAAFFGDIHAPVSETNRIISTSPAWAYLKIAEGCDNNCAYCVIPSIRGRFRSRPIENVVNEAQDLATRGVRELIIVAQDVTMYGLDLYKERALMKLLERLCDIDDVRWIRLHYLYPSEINDNFIDFISNHDKIINYLDIPIQHINDGILRKMNRRGTGDEIRRLIMRLRERIPGIVLRTSIITGLPGEDSVAFDELYEFLEKARIERAGIFQYSPEEGSAAGEMGYPDAEVAAERARVLTDLQAGIMDKFDLTRVGDVVTVLIEGLSEDGNYYGRSFAESPDIDGYITVEGAEIELNEFVEVRIVDVLEGGLRGVKN